MRHPEAPGQGMPAPGPGASAEHMHVAYAPGQQFAAPRAASVADLLRLVATCADAGTRSCGHTCMHACVHMQMMEGHLQGCPCMDPMRIRRHGDPCACERSSGRGGDAIRTSAGEVTSHLSANVNVHDLLCASSGAVAPRYAEGCRVFQSPCAMRVASIHTWRTATLQHGSWRRQTSTAPEASAPAGAVLHACGMRWRRWEQVCVECATHGMAVRCRAWGAAVVGVA